MHIAKGKKGKKIIGRYCNKMLITKVFLLTCLIYSMRSGMQLISNLRVFKGSSHLQSSKNKQGNLINENIMAIVFVKLYIKNIVSDKYASDRSL